MRQFLVGLLIALSVSSCAQLTNPPFTSFNDGVDWALYAPLKYEIGNSGQIIEVPRGFVTDFASSPWWTWAAIPRIGKYQFAAVVHDYLYWTQSCTKDEADQILYFAMREADVPVAQRLPIYEAVNLGGRSAWNSNAKNRKKGLPRIIPNQFMDIPPNVTWTNYQRFLFKKGVRPEPRVAHPSYCTALQSLKISAIGERAFHLKFGNGNVTAVDGNKLTIRVDKAGKKRVVDSFVERV